MSAKSGNGGKREAAALLLAVGRSVRAAASEAGAAERTLRNWMVEDGFQARVQTLRSEVFGRAVGTLCGVSVRAARTLAKLLKSQDEKVQLAAAKAILEAAPRLRDLTDLEGRLQTVERRNTGHEEGGRQ
jgi:transposase-like protein